MGAVTQVTFERSKKLPSYQKGGKVAKTGPALLHKGETVIPTSNRYARGARGINKAVKMPNMDEILPAKKIKLGTPKTMPATSNKGGAVRGLARAAAVGGKVGGVLSALKDKYNAAYEKGQSTPEVLKIRKNIKGGLRP